MRIRTAAAFSFACLAVCLSVQTQPSVPSNNSFIASRQRDVTEYGRQLFHVDFSSSSWTRHALSTCPALAHHAFAVFENTSGPEPDHYLAAYNLAAAPARPANRPWRGGIIVAHLPPGWGTHTGAHSDELNLIRVFNRLLADERPAGSAAGAMPDNYALATCFASLAGEEPRPAAAPTEPSAPSAKAAPLSGILFEVTSAVPVRRFLAVNFDDRGFVSDAKVFLDPPPTP